MDNSLNKVLNKLEEIENGLINAKPILNIDEVVILTGISKSTLYKLTSTRAIPHYKKGKRLVFDKAEIISWLKSNKISTIDELVRQSSGHNALNK